MNDLLLKLIRRLRPRIGWLLFTLGLAAALCPTLAADESKLELPGGLFAWAGVIGLLIGLRFGRPADDKRQPEAGQRRRSSVAPRALRLALALVAVLIGGALLFVAVGQALPPFGLIAQDVGALLGWLTAALRQEAGWDALPDARAWAYLQVSLPRFWQALVAAPDAGERGARLLVALGGVTTAWLGAIAFGWALARGRNLLGWSLPLLTAVALPAILGGGSGASLMIGLALLLLLAILAGFRRRQGAWERAGTDYSDELIADVLAWGTGAVAVVLALAAMMPTSLSNPLADLLWRDVELPSGIAVLERNIPRPYVPPKIDVGLSSLPALQLGQSLEEPPPNKLALRIKLDAPLKPSPWPHYWRARVFNLYEGRGWTTNARVGDFETVNPVAGAVPDTVVQEIEDLRGDGRILVALPDVFGVDVGASAERLPDGALAALTQKAPASRYRAISRPQELAAPPPLDAEPPDMSGYLGLPRNFPARVGDLARVVTGKAPTPYDRALAIESYLRALPYSYQVRPLPSQGDAVEQFLFDMREGYCTYYASAMAVMARSLGIPARVAIGYATGEYDAASQSYLVRQADAHAWPELYIDGRWRPFEPTPIRPLPARGLPEAQPAPQPAGAPEEQPSNLTGPLIWAGALVTVALLTLMGLRLGRPQRRRELVAQVQARLERDGARAGVPWPTGATLHEYGDLLEPRVGDAADDLREVVALVERGRYGGKPLRGDQEGRLRAAAERALGRLARRRR